jgi:hypothetical protein
MNAGTTKFVFFLIHNPSMNPPIHKKTITGKLNKLKLGLRTRKFFQPDQDLIFSNNIGYGSRSSECYFSYPKYGITHDRKSEIFSFIHSIASLSFLSFL